MKLGPIVLKIRLASTTFGERVAGAAELAIAQMATLQQETAFVVQLADNATPNDYDSGINQKVTERFGVVVALKNDGNDFDKLGLTAYDRLHDIRAEIWGAILGWQITDYENLVSYAGGRLLDMNSAWLWWLFEFEAMIRVDDDDGVDVGRDALDNFQEIYAQYVLQPDSVLPISGGLPTDLTEIDMTQLIDSPHAFSDGFSKGFDVLENQLDQ